MYLNNIMGINHLPYKCKESRPIKVSSIGQINLSFYSFCLLCLLLANMPVRCNGRKKIKYNSLPRFFCSLIFIANLPVRCYGSKKSVICFLSGVVPVRCNGNPYILESDSAPLLLDTICFNLY